MEILSSILAILTGLFVRLVLPIAITIAAIYLLRILDARWQAEAERDALKPTIEKTRCWEIKSCAPEDRKKCPSPASSLPCWQVQRQANGYLREECLTCIVFRNAPVPAHTLA